MSLEPFFRYCTSLCSLFTQNRRSLSCLRRCSPVQSWLQAGSTSLCFYPKEKLGSISSASRAAPSQSACTCLHSQIWWTLCAVVMCSACLSLWLWLLSSPLHPGCSMASSWTTTTLWCPTCQVSWPALFVYICSGDSRRPVRPHLVTSLWLCKIDWKSCTNPRESGYRLNKCKVLEKRLQAQVSFLYQSLSFCFTAQSEVVSMSVKCLILAHICHENNGFWGKTPAFMYVYCI